MNNLKYEPPVYTAAQLRQQIGKQARAFHPKKVGVINYGTLLGVSRRYAEIAFLDGVCKVPIRDVIGVEA